MAGSPKAEDTKGKGEAQAGSGPGMNKILLTIMIILAVPYSLPTLIVLMVGFLPSMVAALVERDPPRLAWLCVGGLNLVGMTPWLLSLWFGNHNLQFAYSLVASVPFLLSAYGGAGCGSMLYLFVPRMYRVIVVFNAERRMISLASSQRKLIDLWGDGVTQPREMGEEDPRPKTASR